MENLSFDSILKFVRNPITFLTVTPMLFLIFSAAVIGEVPEKDRLPIYLICTVFIFAVLSLFGWIMIKRPESLYSPSDYQKDESFLKTLSEKIEDIETKPFYKFSNITECARVIYLNIYTLEKIAWSESEIQKLIAREECNSQNSNKPMIELINNHWLEKDNNLYRKTLQGEADYKVLEALVYCRSKPDPRKIEAKILV